MDFVVFLSHSSHDRALATDVAKRIRAQGATVFFDQDDIEIGDEFEPRIHSALQAMDEFVLLFSDQAVQSQGVLKELGAAAVRQIRIVPVLNGVTRAAFHNHPKAPTYLTARNPVEYDDLDRYLSQLRARIQAKTGRP